MADEPITENPAQAYEDHFVPSIFAPWTRDLMERANPRPGERVIDIACGTGIVTRTLAPRLGPGGKVVGLDFSPAMLGVARAHEPMGSAVIEWRQGNAEALPYPDASFDLALCQQGLQFVADRLAAVREMRRVLTSGGRAVVSVWAPLNLHPVYEALWTHAARHLGVPVPVLAAAFSFTAEELENLVHTAGFDSIDIQTVSLDVRFASCRRFIEGSIASVAAVIPVLAALTTAERKEVSAVIGSRIDALFQPYIQGEELVFPMSALVTMACSTSSSR